MSGLYDTLTAVGDVEVAPLGHLGEYSVDGVAPQAAAFPKSVDGVSEVLSLAAREGKAVTPWGGGTQMALGNVPRDVHLVLGTKHLDRMLFHEPEDLVACFEAGMTLSSIQEKLAKRGQFLPLEAPLPSKATIGGILASNAIGPSRLAFGTARDWLIGIKMVHSDGTVTKSGGRVVKNVTGYDLNKLYTGSQGTLGVIVEAVFKVAPIPPHKGTLAAAYSSLREAMDSASGLLHQSYAPQALEVISRETSARLPALDMVAKSEVAILASFSGRKTALERRLDGAAELMHSTGALSVERVPAEQSDSVWQALTDLPWSQEDPPLLVAKVSLLPSLTEGMLGMADLLNVSSISPGFLADTGSGTIRFLWWGDQAVPVTREGVTGAIDRLRDAARRKGGHVIVERCPLEVKPHLDVWGDPPEGLDVMRRIKGELDPHRILNPGRFAGGI